MFGKLKNTVLAAIDGFADDELMTRAAALAFYAALSIAPLLILLVWALSYLHPAWQGQLVEALTAVVGPRAAQALRSVIDSAKAHPRLGDIAGIIGILVTVFTASAVFAQLQGTLNRVWRVKPKPGEAVGAWLRARARAFALLGGIGFMLIVSFVVSAVIQTVVPGDTAVWSAMEYLISAVVFVGAFGIMYKLLPDAYIQWADAFLGAALTAALFLAGKYLIGIYIDHSNVGGAYGPASALIVLLTWVYYSSIIVLMGAELTRGVAAARGQPIRPTAHAVEIEPAPAEKSRPESMADPLPVPRPARPRRPAIAPIAAGTLLAAGFVGGMLAAQAHRRVRFDRRH